MKKDLLSEVDITSSTAVYVQIEDQVRLAVASGDIEPGERLPSIKDLSERLGVNPNTVAKSYRDLELLGILYTRRGMGVFITDQAPAICQKRAEERLRMLAKEIASEARAAGMKSSEIRRLIDEAA